MPTFGSLFSGLGGFDTALERSGFECRWQVEINPDANRVLAKHWPDVKRYKDICDVGRGTLEPVDVICGGWPCFPAGTLILADTGLKDISEVRVGDRVMTHRRRWQPVTKTHQRVADTVELRGRGHTGLRTTANHPFWSSQKREWTTRVGGKAVRRAEWQHPSWVPAENMQGRYWATPHSFPSLPVPSFPGMTSTEAFWKLVGRWLGDGWINCYQRPHRAKGQMAERVLICCAPSEADELSKAIEMAGFRAYRSADATTVRFTISHAGLTRWLEANFGRGAHGKNLPAWALGMKKAHREALLAGYADADGSKVGNRLKLTSVSKSLSIGMRLLATSLGYSACLYEVAVSETKVIGGRTVNQSPWWQLVLRKPSRGQHRDEQHDYGRVRRVQPTNEKEVVYDITVETDESFVADGFTVHNCQDLSVAGKRAGLKGARSGLFWEAARIVGELSPSLVLLENVPGLLSSNAGRDFAAILNAFRELGARDLAWRVLDAQYLGVPQRRRRVFLVADFTDRECAGPILFESESGAWHPQKGRKAGQEVAAGLTRGSAAGRGVNAPGRRQEDDVNVVVSSLQGGGDRGYRIDAEGAAGGQPVPLVAGEVAPVLTSHPGRNTGNDETFVTHALSAEGADASEDGTGRGTPLTVAPILEAQGRSGESQRDGTGIGTEGDPMFTLQAGHQHAVAFGIRSDAVRDGEAKTPSLDAEGVSRLRDPGMGIYEDLAPTLDAAAAHFVGHETVSFAENQRGEVRTSDIAPQLTGGGGKAGQGYSATAGTFGVRRLLPVECERLQGLPEVTQTARITVCQNCLDLHENRVLAGSPNRKLPSVAGNVENNESKESALSVAHLSARSDQNAKRPVVVDVLISSEGRNLAIRSQGRFLEYVNGAVVNGASPLLSQPDGFARLVALTLTTLENETQHGRAESQPHTTSSITQLNGSAAVNLCGRENAEHVSDAVAPGEMENSSIKFTTSQVGRDFPLSDSNSQTLCFSVVRAIASFIPGQMQDGNLYDISLTISRGWTEGLSDSARYRLIGNAVAVPVIEWIARRMFAALAREEEVA